VGLVGAWRYSLIGEGWPGVSAGQSAPPPPFPAPAGPGGAFAVTPCPGPKPRSGKQWKPRPADADVAQFHVQVDPLIEAVRISGMIKPMDDLQDALICRAPDAPRAEEAAHWCKAKRASGKSPVTYDDAQLQAIAADVDPQDQTRAFDAYETAWKAGFYRAGMRLLGHASDANSMRHEPVRAADLYADLSPQDDPGQVVSLRARLRKDDPSISTLTRDRIDPAALCQHAALAGEPVAMRDYGLIFLDTAQTEAATSEAADWLARASKAGDGQAKVRYAQLLALGVGVDALGKNALYWLAIAADKGIKPAERPSNSLTADKGVTL
jgi:hypothetical protein